jgi:1-acyl-sn-glycerol-3-phosphate acyltransferase
LRCRLNSFITRWGTSPFVNIHFKGEENFPREGTFCIVANHTSALDAFVMAMIADRNFRAIVKSSVLWYPVLGGMFFFGGHVMVNRKSEESRNYARHRTRELLENGVSVLYFPEGTRSSGPMLP